MKRAFVLLMLLVFSVGIIVWQRNTAVTTASLSRAGYQNDESVEEDKEAIRQVVQWYLDVTDKNEHENIAKAFHPEAKLMSVSSNDELTQLSLEDWWKRISRIAGKIERVSKISLIDVTGIAAIVRVDYARSSDYISLLKLGGQWKIVNKTLSTKL